MGRRRENLISPNLRAKLSVQAKYCTQALSIQIKGILKSVPSIIVLFWILSKTNSSKTFQIRQLLSALR